MPNIKFLPIVLFVCVSAGCFYPDNEVSSLKTVQEKNEQKTVKNISKDFIDSNIFLSSDKIAGYALNYKPVAGVVNHHVLAADIIAEFFKTLKKNNQDINFFVILSPDHLAKGNGISISDLNFSTVIGVVDIYEEGFIKLKEAGYWDGSESRAFENEHGVGVLVPFIAREFPEAKILPIYIRSDSSLDQSRILGRKLATILPENCMIIISSDMSHFLNSAQSVENDKRTLDWLSVGDWERLENATDNNTDSGASFSILKAYFDERTKLSKEQIFNFKVLAHKSSIDYGGDPGNVTTYITGFWYQKPSY